MARNAIYFPYINVPADPWLLRMALYWDELQSIVPMDYANNPELLEPQMREMVAAGLIRPIFPAYYFYGSQEFAEPFLRYVEQWVHRRRGNVGKEFSQVHAEKLENLVAPLMHLGLIEDAGYPWFRMPTPLANAFMSYLATFLGRLEEINAAPITNSTRIGGSLIGTSRSLAREALLQRLLPIPGAAEHITLDSVLKFKAKYSAQARIFRERLEAECVLIGSLDDQRERNAQLQALSKKLKFEVDEVSDAMKLTWKSVVLGGILPVIAGGLPVLDADWRSQPYAAAGAVGSVAAAVYQATQAINAAKLAQNRPLAYVALAQDRLL